MIRLKAVGAVIAAILLAGRQAAVDPIRDAQWHLAYLNVADAHKISQGTGVTVALLDTGVDARHPDLSGSVLAGTDFSLDGPGDGLTDRPRARHEHGWFDRRSRQSTRHRTSIQGSERSH